MYHKDGKILELQQKRRLLLLKYSWEAKSLSQLAKITGIPRGAMYRYFDDDPKLKAVVDARIAGEASPLTPEELLQAGSDEGLAVIPTLKQIAMGVVDGYRGMSRKVEGMVTPKVADLPRRHVVVEVEPPVAAKPTERDDKIRKAEQVCELIANGSTTNQACEVLGIKTITFLTWINPASSWYIKEVSDMFTMARAQFNAMMDEETQMLAKQSLRILVEGRSIKLQTKIGRVDKEGKIKTTQIRETEKSIEPSFAAVAKVLTTREAEKYGTPEERRLMQNAATGENYELRQKTLEELEAEERALMELLNGKQSPP